MKTRPSPDLRPPLLHDVSTNRSADEILGSDRGQGLILQPYRPLCQSLDWELGQLFYLKNGNQGFVDGDVPYLVNNDGLLAGRAATLFFKSLEERKRSADQADVRILELGAGSCVFARGFLKAFERICRQHDRDYSSRLRYVASDHSETMLKDANRHGILPAGNTVLMARADAVRQNFTWLNGEIEPPIQFDAIFLNYLLDCLPAAVLRSTGGQMEQLHVQTELPLETQRSFELTHPPQRLVELANGTSAQREELMDLYPLFTMRCRYQPVLPGDLPYLDQTPAMLDGSPLAIHSYAALACLETSLPKLRDGGFILISDYSCNGHQIPAASQGDRAALLHQRFGSSTAMGVNFDQLKYHFRESVWLQPELDDITLTVRLLGSNPGPETSDCFRHEFDRTTLDLLRERHELARRHRGNGAHHVARDCYRDAIRSQPENWALLAESAEYCESVLNDHQAALELARLGLDLNPIDTDLWNTFGDSLYSLGRHQQAHQAYAWALQLSPGNVRARYNLVYTLTRQADFSGALSAIADALALDGDGAYTDRLVQRQTEILQTLKQKKRLTKERIADRCQWAD